MQDTEPGDVPDREQLMPWGIPRELALAVLWQNTLRIGPARPVSPEFAKLAQAFGMPPVAGLVLTKALWLALRASRHAGGGAGGDDGGGENLPDLVEKMTRPEALYRFAA